MGRCPEQRRFDVPWGGGILNVESFAEYVAFLIVIADTSKRVVNHHQDTVAAAATQAVAVRIGHGLARDSL